MWLESAQKIGEMLMAGGGLAAFIYLFLNKDKFKAEAKTTYIKGELAITGEWRKYAETLEKRLETLAKQIEQQGVEIAELKAENQGQDREIAQLRVVAANQEEEIAELRAENGRLAFRCEELEKENAHLRRGNDGV